MRDWEQIRSKTMPLFAKLDTVEDGPELVMTVLMDAVMIVEAYRRARHQVLRLPELSQSVDKLLRELEIVVRTEQWEQESAASLLAAE